MFYLRFILLLFTLSVFALPVGHAQAPANAGDNQDKKAMADLFAEELKAEHNKKTQGEKKPGALDPNDANQVSGKDTVLINVYATPEPGSPLLGAVPVYKSSNAFGLFNYSYYFYKKLLNRKTEFDRFNDLMKTLGFATISSSDNKGEDAIKKLNDFIARNSGNDEGRVLFYFSGHLEKLNDKLYFINIDSPKIDNELQFKKTSIDIEELIQKIDVARIKSAMIIFDGCGSTKLYEPLIPVNPKIIHKKIITKSRQVIFSCNEKQLLKDDISYLSSIFDVLIGRSEEEAKDGIITASEMYNFSVTAHTKLTVGGQTPLFFAPKGQESEFLFKTIVDQKTSLKQAIIPARGTLITSHKIYVRDIPDAEGNSLATIAPNTKINIIGKAIGRDWYLTKFGNVEGFVFAQQLRSDENNKVTVEDQYLSGDKDQKINEYDAFASQEAIEKRSRDVAVGDRIKDCQVCPSLVVMGGEEFLLGERDVNYGKYNESPITRITFKNTFGFGEKEITVAEYDRFVQETKYDSEKGCFILVNGQWIFKRDRSWKSPGYPVDPSMPVSCVNYADILAYIKWINTKIQVDDPRKLFRLPSEAEWEFATRANTVGLFYWGKNDFEACQFANHLDYLAKEEIFRVRDNRSNLVNQCSDDYIYPAQVGSFKPNGFGIYDALGNIAEWTADCWHDSYLSIPKDGSPWTRYCSAPDYYVIRGGSWASEVGYLRMASRTRLKSNVRSATNGFRLVRTIRYLGSKSAQDIIFGGQ